MQSLQQRSLGKVRFWASPHQPDTSQLLFFTVEPIAASDAAAEPEAIARYKQRRADNMQGYIDGLRTAVTTAGGTFRAGNMDTSAFCTSPTFRSSSSRYGHVSLSVSFDHALQEYQRLLGTKQQLQAVLLCSRQFKKELCTSILITSNKQAEALGLARYDPTTTADGPWRCERDNSGFLLRHRWYLRNSASDRPFLKVNVKNSDVSVQWITSTAARDVYIEDKAKRDACFAQWDKLEFVFDMSAALPANSEDCVEVPYKHVPVKGAQAVQKSKTLVALGFPVADVVLSWLSHEGHDFDTCLTHLKKFDHECPRSTTASESQALYEAIKQEKINKRQAKAAAAAAASK